MTDDEIMYAASEALQTIEDLRAALEKRHRGKKVRAYGDRLMRIDTVSAQTHPYGGFHYRGTILNKNGTANKAMNPCSVAVETAQFVD